MDLHPDFKEFLQLLNSHHVDLGTESEDSIPIT